MDLDMEKARREEMRWLVLRALYSAMPIGTSEVIIAEALKEVIPGVTDLEIRNTLDYLCERKIVNVERNRPVWFAKINRHGIDIVEYTVPCEPGIARPEKW